MPEKILNVKPLYKSGNENEFGNYRLISLLPVNSKVVEKCLKKKLILFLSKYSVKKQGTVWQKHNLCCAGGC